MHVHVWLWLWLCARLIFCYMRHFLCVLILRLFYSTDHQLRIFISGVYIAVVSYQSNRIAADENCVILTQLFTVRYYSTYFYMRVCVRVRVHTSM